MKQRGVSSKLHIILAALSLLMIAFDQWTKYWAVEVLKPVGKMPFLSGILQFRYVENTGAAFGMLSEQRWIFLLLTGCTLIAGIVLLVSRTIKSPVFTVCIYLILAGGIGNMIDRIFRGSVLFNGAVVDFLEFEFIDFPVFNVADCLVTGACVLLIGYLIWDMIFPQKTNTTAKNAACVHATDGEGEPLETTNLRSDTQRGEAGSGSDTERP